MQYRKWKAILRNLNYVQYKGKDLNGIYPHGLQPNGKGMVLLKIIFRSGNRHGKDKKDTS